MPARARLIDRARGEGHDTALALVRAAREQRLSSSLTQSVRPAHISDRFRGQPVAVVRTVQGIDESGRETGAFVPLAHARDNAASRMCVPRNSERQWRAARTNRRALAAATSRPPLPTARPCRPRGARGPPYSR
jgi:hypothetical protein